MKDEYLNMMICAEEDPELYGIVRHFLQHEVSAADRLSVIDRHLCVLSALMGCQVRTHLRRRSATRWLKA